MNRVFISIGNINIYWYSILILIALVLGYLLFKRGAKNTEIKKEVLDDMIFYMIIWAIIGARIYYVIFNLDSFTSIYDVMAIYNGGLAIYGGIIASVIFLLIYCKRKNLDFIIITDLLVPSLILGQAIGRWGNYFNIEAYGEVVSLSFLTNLHIPNFIIDSFYINGNYHHPTFFYESMGCLLGFIILLIIKDRKSVV